MSAAIDFVSNLQTGGDERRPLGAEERGEDGAFPRFGVPEIIGFSRGDCESGGLDALSSAVVTRYVRTACVTMMRTRSLTRVRSRRATTARRSQNVVDLGRSGNLLGASLEDAEEFSGRGVDLRDEDEDAVLDVEVKVEVEAELELEFEVNVDVEGGDDDVYFA